MTNNLNICILVSKHNIVTKRHSFPFMSSELSRTNMNPNSTHQTLSRNSIKKFKQKMPFFHTNQILLLLNFLSVCVCWYVFAGGTYRLDECGKSATSDNVQSKTESTRQRERKNSYPEISLDHCPSNICEHYFFSKAMMVVVVVVLVAKNVCTI